MLFPIDVYPSLRPSDDVSCGSTAATLTASVFCNVSIHCLMEEEIIKFLNFIIFFLQIYACMGGGDILHY